MGNSTIIAAQKISSANKSQTSQGLLIQKYANSVKEQPDVDFSGFKNLEQYQTDINSGLKTAKEHADTYLNKIQPAIITNISNISNYYALHNAVAATLPPGSTEKQWIEALTALKEQSQDYQTDAKNVVGLITTLHNDLTTDAAAFAKFVSDLNTAVNGDNGVLSSINDELSSIQSKIDGAIAGTVLSGLAIVGGVFIAAVGAVADFVTAGTSTPLVVGGVALILAGVGGEVGSAIALKALNDEKADLLQQKAKLKDEVKLASGMSSAYSSLGDQVKAAVKAATEMQSAWEFLDSDLGNLISDLDNGITSTGEARKLFLTAANTEVATVNKDITIIKHQMTGVQNVGVPQGGNVGDAIVEAAKKAA